MSSTWYSDTEVFAHDWLFVAKSQESGEIVTFWNDPDGVRDFIETEQPILCGYNYKMYDSYILKGILLGWEPEDIHHISMTIIEGDDHSRVWALFTGQPWVTLPHVIDIMPDIVPRKGLKEIEANIGMSIVESDVSFDIDRPLTEDERDEVLRYCIHDVTATEQLYDLRYDYLKSKSDLCELRGVDPLDMLKHTNARIVSEVLQAQRIEHLPFETYEIPDNIDLTTIPQDVIDFVQAVNTDNCMEKGDNKLEFMFHDCPTTFALGGIHAAVPSYKEAATNDRVILIQDIGSFYPSIIINNGYMSRAVADESVYKQFYDMRMSAKASGDKATAEAAKLVLNTTFGTMKDKYNKMFDPMQGTRVCLSGQLYIIDLIEQLFRHLNDLQLIQLNTDGWVISCNREDIWVVEEVVKTWQERTGFTVDTEEIETIVQANVNNYVLRTVDGKVKAKGGVVARHAGGDFKSNSMTIIDKAVVAYLLDGIPIEQTVNECDDLMRFQIIAKAGRTYKKVVHECPDGEMEVQRVNRVYAWKDKAYGGIFKVKEDGSRAKIPDTPKHCFVDNENLLKSGQNGLTMLDKSWYVDVAVKKATEFLTRKKKEKEQMAKVNESHNEAEQKATPTPRRRAAAKPAEEKVEVEPTPIPPFKVKLLGLQEDMAKAAQGVIFDKAISTINYEYADTQQYKAWLSGLCTMHRLVVKVDVKCEFLGIIGSSKTGGDIYAAQADGVVTISDVDTDASETYMVTGFGSNVQPGYCNGAAQTNMLRNFILNTFMLDNRGREGDDQAFNADATTSAKSGYVAPEQKAQMKQGIKDAKADDAKYATDMFAVALYDKIMEARKYQPDFAAKTLGEHFNEDGTPKLGENGKSTMLKKKAVTALTKAEEIIAEGEESDDE